MRGCKGVMVPALEECKCLSLATSFVSNTPDSVREARFGDLYR
jgi:hypothetical protein